MQVTRTYLQVKVTKFRNGAIQAQLPYHLLKEPWMLADLLYLTASPKGLRLVLQWSTHKPLLQSRGHGHCEHSDVILRALFLSILH